ncbi:Uncharacterised protein [Bordetella pertussis]|nr:Uncharacterised protein [Bordetella pertussis]CFW31511.1 Uncharacterised protein [Bordetella pertussis]
MPPYSAGLPMPSRPAEPSAFMTWWAGNICAASHSSR